MTQVIYRKSPRARKLTIKIDHSGDVIVVVPRWTPLSLAEKFVHTHQAWIQKHQKKIGKPRTRLTTDQIQTLRSQAKNHLPSRTQQLAQRNNLHVASVSIRHQKTRWGSCSSRNTISLNCELMRLPEALQDYVILHELAHVKHKDHSKNFWNYLESICPGSKTYDKQLKKYKLGLANETNSL